MNKHELIVSILALIVTIFLVAVVTYARSPQGDWMNPNDHFDKISPLTVTV